MSFRATPVAAWRVNGVGWATTVVGNTVYVGGQFTTATSPTGQTVGRANLAAFDATTGALRTTFVANTNGVVRSLASDGSRLFVGGSFTTIGGQSRSRLAAVDLNTGAVSGTWVSNSNSHVYALSVGGGRLYAGGSFSSIGGASRSRIAALSLTNGTAVAGFTALGQRHGRRGRRDPGRVGGLRRRRLHAGQRRQPAEPGPVQLGRARGSR